MRIIKFIFVIIISIFLLHCENVNLGETYFITYYGENPKWTPDCSKIAFINPVYYEDRPALCYIDTDGNNFSVIEMDVAFYWIGQFCFINNGDFIVFSGNELYLLQRFYIRYLLTVDHPSSYLNMREMVVIILQLGLLMDGYTF